MMFRFLLIFSTLWISGAVAAPIIVKSGEHGSFTRLVVYLEDDANWEMVHSINAAKFKLPSWRQGFDISDVYRRIGRERFASLETQSDELHLFWTCDCTIDVTPLSGGLVQIDITAAPKVSTIRQVVPDERSILFQDVKEENKDHTSSLPWPISSIQKRNYFAIDEISSETNRVPLRAFRRGLEEQLATSSTNKNLELSGAELVVDRQLQPNGDESREELLELLSDRVSFSDASSAGIDSTDLDGHSICSDGLDLNVSSWAEESNFSSQLNEKRSNLHAEFDVPDLDAAKNLIKFYLYFDLADEALQLLEAFDIDDSDKRLFRGLGKGLIAAFSNPQPELAEYSDCLGEKGFWGALNAKNTSDISDEKIESLIAIFSGLPAHLQTVVADPLISRLSEFGNPTAVGIIKNTLARNFNSPERNGFTNDPRTLWPGLSIETLTDLVEADNVNSPLALAILLEKHWRLEVPPDPGLVELAAAFAFQLGANEMAKRLNSARIFSQLQLEWERAAINALISLWDDELIQPQETLEKFIFALTDAAPIAIVSEFAWKASSSMLDEQFSTEARIVLAQHFLEFGQPQLALLMLPNIDSAETAEEQRVWSQIEILMGHRPLNLKDVDPELSLKNFPILESFLLKDSPEKVWNMQDNTTTLSDETIAWLAQEWGEVPIESSRGRLARLLANEPSYASDPQRPISAAQNASDRSRNTREALTTLMNNDG